MSKFTETVRNNSSNGSVSCTITIYGDGLSEQRGREAVNGGAASALCTIGHIAQKLQEAAMKGHGMSAGVKRSTHSLSLDGVTVRVTMRARYDAVKSTLTTLLLQDAPATIVKSVLMKALGINERDILRDIADILGEDNPLAKFAEAMSGDREFGGMPPFGADSPYGGFGREPVGAHNGSGLGQYL